MRTGFCVVFFALVAMCNTNQKARAKFYSFVVI